MGKNNNMRLAKFLKFKFTTFNIEREALNISCKGPKT